MNDYAPPPIPPEAGENWTSAASTVVGLAFYTPESWHQLKEAVAEAGMPKDALCGSYAEFVIKFDETARGFRGHGVEVRKVMVDVPHMVAWCKRWGLEINSRGRAKYGVALSAVGGDRERVDKMAFSDRTRTEH